MMTLLFKKGIALRAAPNNWLCHPLVVFPAIKHLCNCQWEFTPPSFS